MERELVVNLRMRSRDLGFVHISNGDPNLDSNIEILFSNRYNENRDYIAKQLGYEILSWLELMRDEYEDYKER